MVIGFALASFFILFLIWLIMPQIDITKEVVIFSSEPPSTAGGELLGDIPRGQSKRT